MILGYNVHKIRNDFPILNKKIIYLDNACMSLKPVQVIEKINEYYKEYTACSGRSSHALADKVTTEVINTRDNIKKFINAKKNEEIIFTRNTTEGINILSNTIGLKKDDEVIITDKEHNSNLIPWLKLKKQGIKVKIIKTNEDNTFNIENLERTITNKTKLASIVYTSNIDGVTNPIKEITKILHKNNIKIIVDGAQAMPSKEIDVKESDIDYLVFSGHKMLGPTGTGILYGKKELLEKNEQYNVGGETVTDSTYETYKIEELPMKYEAGLQDYAGIIGLNEAIKYLKKIGMKNIEKQEIKLNKIITEELTNDKIEIIGPKYYEKRSGIYSFNIKGMDNHDVSKILEMTKNIMTRSGRHCVHSWYNSRGIEGSVRASLYLYNTEEEAQIFTEEVKKIVKNF